MGLSFGPWVGVGREVEGGGEVRGGGEGGKENSGRARTEHEGRLGEHPLRLGRAEHGQRLLVPGAEVPHAGLEPLDRFDVVREDIEARAGEVADGGEVAAEVRG